MVDLIGLALISEGALSLGLVTSKTVSLKANFVSKGGSEISLHVREINSIVGTLGTSKRRLHAVKIELHDITGVDGVSLSAVILNEQVLFSQVLLNGLNLRLVSTRDSEEVHGLTINREVTHGSTVLWGHVCNSGTISNIQALNSGSEILNELADNTSLSEHLGASKHQICSSDVLLKLASQLESDNLRKDHGNDLTKHDSLSFNTTDTPASNTKTIYHSGVRVSADNGVGV